MTLVKICGITYKEDAQMVALAGADFVGFNFYRGSSRYVEPEKVREIVRVLPKTTVPVAVFVDEKPGVLEKILEKTQITMIQLHGNEDLDYIQEIARADRSIIKAIRVDSQTTDHAKICLRTAKWLLFDRKEKGMYGGTGQLIESDILRLLFTEGLLKNAFLAGGLTPKNIGSIVNNYNPFAVDVASGVELKPGIKDKELVKAFIHFTRHPHRALHS